MKILMVCLGNICRSPLAEGILRNKIEKHGLDVLVDSAGTGSWHVGEYPDMRAISVAKKFGIDISKLTGRQFSADDFDAFDKIFVMDHDNHRDVAVLARHETDLLKVDLLLNAGKPRSNRSVPDPYYGGEDGFVEVFKQIDKACDAIIAQLMKNHE